MEEQGTETEITFSRIIDFIAKERPSLSELAMMFCFQIYNCLMLLGLPTFMGVITHQMEELHGIAIVLPEYFWVMMNGWSTLSLVYSIILLVTVCVEFYYFIDWVVDKVRAIFNLHNP